MRGNNLKELYIITKYHSFFISVLYFAWKIYFKLLQLISKSGISKSIVNKLNAISETLFLVSHQVSVKNLDVISINDVKYMIRPNTSDFAVLNQIVLQKSYNSLVNSYKRSFGNKPKIIYDLGANVGYSTVYFSHEFGNECIIKCFEPFHSNFKILEENIKDIENIFAFNNAVWNETSYLKFDRNFRDNKEWSIVITEGKTTDYDIIGLNLSELINSEEVVDILKIDIEGSEKRLFSNEEYSQSFLSKVKCICIEIHDEFECRPTIYNHLSTSGFIFYDNADLTIGINKNYL